MVTASVGNEPVSIQLSASSTTVPSNETWVVTVMVGANGNPGQFTINGTEAIKGQQVIPNIVVTGDDTLEEQNGGTGPCAFIQGFVVDS